MKSIEWKHMPFICNICEMLIIERSEKICTELMENVLEEDDLAKVFEQITKKLQNGL